MKFRTEIKLQPQQENLLDHKSKVLLMRSCFSENIGSKLSYYKFDTLTNPFGVLFNPIAIAKVLADTIQQYKYDEKELIKQGAFYHSLHHHSDFSSTNSSDVVTHIHQAQYKCLEYLKTASHIVITLGTSWVYKFNQTNEFVANCHKIPQTEFKKQLLSVEEIETALINIVTNIASVNNKAKVLFTVSPVRHTKDGLVENSLSKAHLLSAIGAVVTRGHCESFGSYEIMMDDLRDYRFYEADMIHPNKVAIDYIWECFSKVWIAEKAQSYFKRIAAVQQGKQHRPFHEDSELHQEFLKKLAMKQLVLEKELHVKF